MIAGLPLVGAFFDVIENSCILILLSRYHYEIGSSAELLGKWNGTRAFGIVGGFATCLKWTFLTILPGVVYYNEVWMSPRKDEILFSDHFTKLDYEYEVKMENIYKASKEEKSKSK